jgi:predicted transcriptional regulator of viral defense system
MGRYNLGELTKKIYESGLLLFESKTLRDILEVKKEASFYSAVKRLIKARVLQRVERGKYILKGAEVGDFALATFLYSPSYVSFESALNFHGILSQFPYEISSATTRKPLTKTFEDKTFSYFRIKKELFFGYEKREDFLIALPEKALLDQLYFWAKGLKAADLSEFDLSAIRKSRLKEFLSRYPRTKQTKKVGQVFKKHMSS